MAFQLAEIVAELVPPVGFLRESKRGEDGRMGLSGSPAADGGATMQEDFHQANDPRVMDFDSGIADGADGHGQGQTLQQREIHMDIEPLGLAIGETIGSDLESFGRGYFRTTAKYTENQRVRAIWPGCGDGLDRGYENNPGFCFNPGVWILPVWPGDAGWFARVCRGGSVGFSTCGIAEPPSGTAERLLGRV